MAGGAFCARPPPQAPWARLQLRRAEEDVLLVEFKTDWSYDDAVRQSRRNFFDCMVTAMKQVFAGPVQFSGPRKQWAVKGMAAWREVVVNFSALGFAFKAADLWNFLGLAWPPQAGAPDPGTSQQASQSSGGFAGHAPIAPCSTPDNAELRHALPLHWAGPCLCPASGASQSPVAGPVGRMRAVDWQHSQASAHVDSTHTVPHSSLQNICPPFGTQSAAQTWMPALDPAVPPGLPRSEGLAPAWQEVLEVDLLLAGEATVTVQAEVQPAAAADTTAAGEAQLADPGADWAENAAAEESLPPPLEMVWEEPVEEIVLPPPLPVQPTPRISPARRVARRASPSAGSSAPSSSAPSAAPHAAAPGASAAASAVAQDVAGAVSSGGQAPSQDAPMLQPAEEPLGAGSCAGDSECTICMDAPVDTVFVPCGHMAVCHACSKKFLKKPCPMCRKRIKIAQRVFVS